MLLQVRLLEASGRIGGRVHDDHSLGRCVGLGAMFITGVANNPFTLLSQQLNHPLRIINEETCELFNESGGRPDKQLDLATEGHYNTTLDRLAEWRSRHGSDISLESMSFNIVYPYINRQTQHNLLTDGYLCAILNKPYMIFM